MRVSYYSFSLDSYVIVTSFQHSMNTMTSESLIVMFSRMINVAVFREIRYHGHENPKHMYQLRASFWFLPAFMASARFILLFYYHLN